jgi:hypothetical protein
MWHCYKYVLIFFERQIYNMEIDPKQIAKMITEDPDEYADFEDADEFESGDPDGYTHFHPATKTLFELGECENCGRDVQEANSVGYVNPDDEMMMMGYHEYEGSLPPEIAWDDALSSATCGECGHDPTRILGDFKIETSRIPPRSSWLHEEKHQLRLLRPRQGPIIRNIQWSPAAITIQFPSGEIWEYVIYENRWLQDLLKSHRRNVGRLVAAMKRIPNIEVQRVLDLES